MKTRAEFHEIQENSIAQRLRRKISDASQNVTTTNDNDFPSNRWQNEPYKKVPDRRTPRSQTDPNASAHCESNCVYRPQHLPSGINERIDWRVIGCPRAPPQL